MSTYNVGIFIHEGVELLDFAGPGEAFSSAQKNGEYLFEVFTVAKDKEPILCQDFLTLVPKYSFADAPTIDILVLPGGDTKIPLAEDETMRWVLHTSNKSEVVMSVCTGALLLARAGLLDGLRATTHWKWINRMREAYPNVEVEEGVRFIDNGKFITTEGISAGIDGSLYLIERLYGEEVARDLAHYMVYDWRKVGKVE